MSSNSDNTIGVDGTARVAANSATKIKTRNGKPTTVADEDLRAPEVLMDSTEKMKSPMPWLDVHEMGPELKATPRDYLDRPSTLAQIRQMYSDSGSTFAPSKLGIDMPERIVPIDKQGNLGSNSSSSTERDSAGGNRTSARVPRTSMAVIHSHPYGTGPQPSDADYDAAKKLNAPNFELSQGAIYVAE